MKPDDPDLKKKAIDDVRIAINTAYSYGVTREELDEIIKQQY